MILLARRHPGPLGSETNQPKYPSHTYYSKPPPQPQPQHQLHRRSSPIERLPNQVLQLICSDLDYQSLIFLSMVNRHFHSTVNPQIAPTADKFQFIMRAAKDFPQHRAIEKKRHHRPGNSECYMCFRVRAPQHFDVLQAVAAYIDPRGRIVSGRRPGSQDQRVALRRFCIGCGVRSGLHAPFDCLTTKTGQNLWVCRCRKVWQKPNCLRCPDCESSCPLRPKAKW
ncbi:hypothetical protein F66182_8937 [Fusarium sp. NRRL 66182]|nr:hypothetical protein F66182_8937 [Fusarium sp. NRRL 66182]